MEGVPPESIRLYAIAKAMKWNHLPVAGGLYDQDPKLMDEWTYIMGEESKERARREREQNRNSGAGQAKSPGRFRRKRR